MKKHIQPYKPAKTGNRTLSSRKTAILASVTAISGILTLVFALAAAGTPPALAQTPSNVGVNLSAGILSIIYTPSDFTMTPVNIDSPVTTYYSYYNNPRTIDPDGNPSTRDGTAIRVQDGRFQGGFELQAQISGDYSSGGGTIPASNLGVRTDIGGLSQIDETVTPGAAATAAPLDTVGDYTAFSSPLVLLEGSTADCSHGRVGIYTVYPSFRLLVPNATPAGTYTTSVTYTLLEQPSC